jgi:signal transduction histidine kinase
LPLLARGRQIASTNSPKTDIDNGESQTLVITDQEIIDQTVNSFLEKASRAPLPYVYSITDKTMPDRTQRSLGVIRRLKKANPKFEGQFIIDVQAENVEVVKKIIQAGVQVRHIEGNLIGFSVSQSEYLNQYLKEGTSGEPSPSLQMDLVYSNNADLVLQMRDVFRALWRTAIPAEREVKQLELAIEPEETRIITDAAESASLERELLRGVKKDVAIILASGRTIERNSKTQAALLQQSKERGARIRILAPLPENGSSVSGDVEWRKIEPISTGIAIYDGLKMLITQYEDPEAQTFDPAVVSNIYTTEKHTISGMTVLFNALWRESKRRAEETRDKSQAQLLQDILAHDIRNYNQVELLAAETLQDQLSAIPVEARASVDRLMRAIKGSTDLVEHAIKLGRILSEQKTTLRPVELEECISTSLQLARDTHPDRVIRHENWMKGRDRSGGVVGSSKVLVLADSLLAEAFVNIYTNCIKYTPAPKKVLIQTIIDEVVRKRDGLTKHFWRIAITDHGAGIPDDAKGQFVRYQKSSGGKGLGLSIVHALVVGRYSGELIIKNRVEGDYSKGTRVEVLLERAEAVDHVQQHNEMTGKIYS